MKKLIYYPDSKLYEKCKPISNVDADVVSQIQDMFEIMRDNGGIGLAAPQVGWPARVFIINLTGADKDKLVFINPEITNKSKDTDSDIEGCLSLPDVFLKIERAITISVEALNIEGMHFELTVSGVLARCIQHENDHINSLLMIDKLSTAKRSLLLSKLKNAKLGK